MYLANLCRQFRFRMTGITLFILEYGELVQGVCQPSAHAEISPDRFGDLLMAHILIRLVSH